MDRLKTGGNVRRRNARQVNGGVEFSFLYNSNVNQADNLGYRSCLSVVNGMVLNREIAIKC